MSRLVIRRNRAERDFINYKSEDGDDAWITVSPGDTTGEIDLLEFVVLFAPVEQEAKARVTARQDRIIFI